MTVAVATESVLVVDDDRHVRVVVAEMLAGNGFDVVVAADAAAARDLVLNGHLQLVLADVSMPGGSGLDLAALLAAESPGSAVLMMSGSDDPALARRALEVGAYGFLIKPFGRSELIIAVKNALRRRTLEIESRARREQLEHAVADRTEELRRSREETIRRLAAAVEARDHETGVHVSRMSRLCGELARGLGVEEEQSELIALASTLHDIGKIGVPDGILLKPGPLTAGERVAMEHHAEAGHRILSGSGGELLDLAASIALTHHERLDGSGYPRGLVGDAIPVEGQIAAVADVFDALTSDRVYRKAFTREAALAHVREGAGTVFDQVVVDVLVSTLEEQ